MGDDDDDGGGGRTVADVAIRNRLMNLRNLEAMHALEDEVQRLSQKLRDIEARDKAHQSTDSHFSFVLQRNQELERIIVSSFQEAEALRQDMARLQRKLDAANAKRHAVDETNQLLAEDGLAHLIAQRAAEHRLHARIQELEACQRSTTQAMELLAKENEALMQRHAAEKQAVDRLQDIVNTMQVNHNALAQSLAQSELKLSQLELEKEQTAQLLLAHLETTLEAKQQQMLNIQEVAPESPRACSSCADLEATKEKHKRQVDNLTRQRDKLSKQLQNEKDAGNFARDAAAAKGDEILTLRSQLAVATQQLEKMRQYIKDAENSTSFERYVSLKTENVLLAQQLEQAKSPVKPAVPMSPRGDGSTPDGPKRKPSKPKNVVMPLIGSPSNNQQRPGSWFRLNC